jgi:hypothetical protein
MRILFIFTLIALALPSAAQHRELLPHFPVPQGGPEQFVETRDFSIPPQQKVFHPVNNLSKNTCNCLDTLYPVLYATRFYDVMDSDSAYFVSGYGHNQLAHFHDPDNRAMLIRKKISYSGEVLWTRVDSLMRGDHFTYLNTSLVKTVDCNYLQMGFIANDYNNWKNYMIRLPVYTKFNTHGDIIWQRLYADTTGWRGGDWPMDIIPEDDGGFTVAALTPSVSKTYSFDPNIDWWYNDTTYVSLIRYDSMGIEVHRKSHVIGGDLVTMSIGLVMKQDDGGYVVGGVNRFNGKLNPGEYYLFKTDSLFNWEWIKRFSQTFHSASYMKLLEQQGKGYAFVVSKSDTPIVVSGNQTYYNGYHHVGFMDAGFNIIKDTMFSIKLAPFGSSSSYWTSNGNVIGAAFSRNDEVVFADQISFSEGSNLMLLDSNLQLRWNRWLAYYPIWKERAYKMRAAHDGGYLIVGMTMVAGAGGWLVKTDTLGCALPNCADTLYHIGIETVERGRQEVFVYPNPTADYLNIRTRDNSPLPQGTLLIFNIQGPLQKEITHTAIPKPNADQPQPSSCRIYLGRIVSTSGDGGSFRIVKQ